MLENMKVPYFLSLFAVQTWEPGHFKHGVGNKPTLPDHIGSQENDYGESLFRGSHPLPTHDLSDFGYIEDIGDYEESEEPEATEESDKSESTEESEEPETPETSEEPKEPKEPGKTEEPDIHCITQYYAQQGIFWKPGKTSKF